MVPMFDAFTNKPDFTPFTTLPNQIPLTYGLGHATGAAHPATRARGGAPTDRTRTSGGGGCTCPATGVTDGNAARGARGPGRTAGPLPTVGGLECHPALRGLPTRPGQRQPGPAQPTRPVHGDQLVQALPR